jgi:periplasmic divalent cation tolerance protein
MTEFIQVSTTVNNKQEAEKIARKLLDERLASCVQVLGPINSKYWWRGKIDRAREWICLIKARTL